MNTDEKFALGGLIGACVFVIAFAVAATEANSYKRKWENQLEYRCDDLKGKIMQIENEYHCISNGNIIKQWTDY